MEKHIAEQIDYNINIVMSTLRELCNEGKISDMRYRDLWNLLNFCSEEAILSANNDD